jgi:cobalamin biosynthetic protein CobC
VARLEGELGPWAVSGPALEIGIRALADVDWQRQMRNRLAEESVQLDALFGRFGIAVSGGTYLYRFLELTDSHGVLERLGRRGVLLRNFAWSRTALRCGLPADEAAWQRLERGLASLKGRHPLKVEECQ